MKATSLILAVTLVTLFGEQGLAETVLDCDKALVIATYNRTDQQFVDWRMAESVDEATYDAIKHDASASATIYGIPMGATYGDFKQNISTLKRNNQQSYTKETFRNVAWTGLDANSVNA